jgi:hypothetical protein
MIQIDNTKVKNQQSKVPQFFQLGPNTMRVNPENLDNQNMIGHLLE